MRQLGWERWGGLEVWGLFWLNSPAVLDWDGGIQSGLERRAVREERATPHFVKCLLRSCPSPSEPSQDSGLGLAPICVSWDWRLMCPASALGPAVPGLPKLGESSDITSEGQLRDRETGLQRTGQCSRPSVFRG